MSERTLPRKRGRPPRDYSDDPDYDVAAWAIALQAAWGFSTFDFALAIIHGGTTVHSKIPRGAKAGLLAGYVLPHEQSFHGRARDIRRKLKAGKLRIDCGYVLEIAKALRRLRRLPPRL